MEIDGGLELLLNNLRRQISNYWGFIDFDEIRTFIPNALDRMSNVLKELSRNNRYVWRDGNVVFSPMHSVQYSIFLYFLANDIYQTGNVREADSIYYLNKIMNSVDWFYAIDLPEIFYAEHPLGSVLGRAKYGDRLFIYQGCTIGGSRNKEGILSYPVIGSNVLMYAGSSILGECRKGINVIISAGTRIVNRDIPSCSIVFGSTPNIDIKRVSYEEIHKRQSHIWNDD